MPNRKILTDYDKKIDDFKNFTVRVKGLIEQLISEAGIKLHSITYRIKDRASLSNKLNRPAAHYTELEDITDISGIRIITYLTENILPVSQVIEKEFEVDFQNSIDKSQVLDPDRFGYLSVHYVVSLSKGRATLPEYQKYRDFKCEIQIRTILQHAWAEIQHDLGYKSTVEIPREIKRRFFKLAGLLEIADDEFTRLHDSLNKYKSSLEATLKEPGKEFPLNNETLRKYIQQSELIASIEKEISKNTGLEVKQYELPDEISNTVNRLFVLDIKSIKELDNLLQKNRKILIKIASTFLGTPEKNIKEGGHLTASISIFYLCYVILAQRNDLELFQKYLIKYNNYQSKEIASKVAKRLISLYKRSL
jgi:putative GTP pyrophosphokinase